MSGPSRSLRLESIGLSSAGPRSIASHRRFRLVALASLLAAGWCAPGHAQTRDEIRRQNEQLFQQQQSGGTGFAPPASGGQAGEGGGGGDSGAGVSGSGGGLTAQLLDRVGRLEEQVRSLQGRVDELERTLQTKTASLDKQIGDMNFALQQSHAGATPPAASPAAGEAAPEAAPHAPAPVAAAPPVVANVHRTPEASLKLGNALIARHDYPGAQAAAQDALDSGHGVHAADAEFLLGQSYAGQKNYQQAAVAFYGAYGKSPHGPLAQDALLRVGGAMMALHQNGAACEALGKLRSEFPALRPNIAKSVASMRRGAHC